MNSYSEGQRVQVLHGGRWTWARVIRYRARGDYQVRLEHALSTLNVSPENVREGPEAPALVLSRPPDYERPGGRPVPKDEPLRDAEYLGWLRELPCTYCGAAPPSEASHHGLHGTGTKPGDDLALPSCRACHHRHHQKGAPLLDMLALGRELRREVLALIARSLRARWDGE